LCPGKIRTITYSVSLIQQVTKHVQIKLKKQALCRLEIKKERRNERQTDIQRERETEGNNRGINEETERETKGKKRNT